MIVSWQTIATQFRLAGVGKDVRDPIFDLLDTSFVTVSERWMRDNWEAMVNTLPASLTEWKTVGNTRRLCPLYIPERKDCENHAYGTMVHGAVGNALSYVQQQAAGKTPAEAGLAMGVIHYTAVPRRENLFREGRHAMNWWLNHRARLGFFEPAEGHPTTLLRKEVQSITRVCAI